MKVATLPAPSARPPAGVETPLGAYFPNSETAMSTSHASSGQSSWASRRPPLHHYEPRTPTCAGPARLLLTIPRLTRYRTTPATTAAWRPPPRAHARLLVSRRRDADVHHIIDQPTHHRLSQQDNPGRMLHPGRLLQTLRAVLQLLNVLTGFHDRHPTWFPLGETLPQLPQAATPGTQFRLKNLWEVPNNTINTNKTSNTPYIYVYIIW